MTKEKVSADVLIAHIIEGIEEVKGNDITILDLRDIENTVTSYFIICNGTSNTQVNAIVNSVQRTVSKKIQENPWNFLSLSYSDLSLSCHSAFAQHSIS